MTPEEQRTLDLFVAVESRPDGNQQIARTGISLGLANAFLKTILNKGWIRARKVKARRWYLSPPQGSLEKKPTHLNTCNEPWNHLEIFEIMQINYWPTKPLFKEFTSSGRGFYRHYRTMSWTSSDAMSFKIVKPRIDSEEDNGEWLPEQFGTQKLGAISGALLSEQDEVLQKLSSIGYQDQKHWVSMIWRFF